MVTALLQGVVFGSSTTAVASTLPGVPNAGHPVEGSRSNALSPRLAEASPHVPRKKPDATWPAAGSTVVKLADPSAKAGAPVKAKGQPLALTSGSKTQTNMPVGSVETRVLSQETARKAGVQGLLFTLKAPRTTPGGTVGATLDYSAFAEAFGGIYGERLTLVEMPPCVLTTPSRAACRSTTPLVTTNNVEKKTLTARAVSLAAGSPTVLAAVAGDEGKSGDYKATPLSPSSTWNTDLNSGSFNWSYTFPVPQVPGDMAPKLGLAYSSGGVDGRTGGTNNQSSWVGDGFDLWPGYIERRYKPCADDDVKNADGNKTGDLCWGYNNAFISFNGKGGELVPAGTDEFKLKKDDGTRIKRLASTSRGNGDNDGEHWLLTDPNGNKYYFGYNRLPGWSDGKETTDSTWNVPVFGDDAGEKCHGVTFAESWCNQAWRWNLDYAVDTHGNAIAYYYDKEDNSYGRNLKASDNTRYTRGGYLDRIEYGLKSNSMYSSQALARVDFTSSERCLPGAQTTCASIDTDSFYWFDTPWDLNCDAGEDCDAARLAATFWTRKRLTSVTTEVMKGTTYTPVDSWKMDHRWGASDIHYQLLLDSIQRTGHTATTPITLPKTTLSYTQLPNRMDAIGDGWAPFVKERLSGIDDEYGGQTSVNYSAEACSPANLPIPETNTTRCFPQRLGGSDIEDPETHWFNKYVVTSVTATDRTGGAPDAVTNYEYLDGAAWHYDDDDGLTKENTKTWSQWRGYGHVRVKTGGQGGAAAMKSQQDTYFLRGMDGDRQNATGGTKSVSVALGTGEGQPITDHESAAGFAYKSATYSAPGGSVLEKTVNRPWHHETAKKERSWGTVTANFTGTESSQTFTSLDNGAGTSWRTTSTSTTYDTVAGRIIKIDDHGDTADNGDDQCTRTTYATNAAANILNLPARVEKVAVACGVNPDRSKDVISDTWSAYDGGTYGAEPSKGDATANAVLKHHDGTTGTYLESSITVDSYGRELTATNLSANVTSTVTGTPVRVVRTDGRTTTTTFEPATGIPTKITSKTPPVTADATTAQTTVVTLDPVRGQPLTQTDTNNRVTTLTYDALGRSSKIWLPNRSTSLSPSYAFDYFIEEGKEVAVRSQTLNNSGAQLASYTLFDGFLRERQTQSPGPDGGTLLTDRFYDERGKIAKTFSPYYTTGAPSRTLFKPVDALSVETQTHHTYDGLGRETETKQIAGNGDGGTVLGITQTIYGGDRTTVIPPEGAAATTTLTNARGLTTELRQHHTRSTAAPYDATHYEHTPAGQLAKLTDPAGNAWTYTYDQLGRTTKVTDPDMGTTDNTYNDRSELVTTTNNNKKLYRAYDGIGRQTQLRDTSATGTLRAEWSYDTVTGAKGQLASATRYVNGSAFTTKVTQYDSLYRPIRTAVVIPASEGALQGTYQSGTAYGTSGLMTGGSYSAAGALPGGSYAYTFDATLRPIKLLGDGFQADTSYSFTGKPLQQKFSSTATGAKITQVTNTYEWGTQRLSTSRVDRQDITGVDRYHTYRYDQVGNILSIADVARTGTDNQCFAYDHLSRLTEAWTEGDTTCSTAPGVSVTGGVAPYWHSYTYDKTGNRLTETQHDMAGDNSKNLQRNYTYPPAGSARPHAVTEVAQSGPSGTFKSTFGYDGAGNTETRTIAGDTQTLDWDAEGHLAKITKPVEGQADEVTEYVYDADGNRLISRTATETTLYLGHTEVVLPKGATKPQATRYVDLGDGHQAVKDDNGVVSFTIADHNGTGQLAVNATTLSMTQRRSLPFGNPRGQQPTGWPGSKTFVGGVSDTSTGLTHLGAREYDPSIGRFISVDPVMDLANPQQLHGYAYANNSPITLADPSGLYAGPCTPNCKEYKGGKETTYYPDGSSKVEDSVTHTVTIKENTGSDWLSCQHRTNTIGCTGGFSQASKAHDTAIGIAIQEDPTTYHDILDALGFAPGVGTPADVASSIGYAVEGEWGEAAWGLGAAIPIGGDIAQALRKGGKWIKKMLRLGEKRSKGWDVVTECLTGNHSFVAGTKVLLADGTTKKIEDVELGDRVAVTDPETGEATIREVAGTIVTEDDKHFVDLTFKTKGDATETLTSTTTHPFWVTSGEQWVEAGDLKPGMTLRTPSDEEVVVDGVRDFGERQRTYDLTITGIHTYYVLAGETPVLVHNSGPCPETYWPKGKASDVCSISGSSGCEDVARSIQQSIGGSRMRITDRYGAPSLGKYRGQDSFWGHHDVVVKDGRVYDAWTGPEGEALDVYRRQFEYGDDLVFSGLD
ncbi:RHS repeat-associated core domain-containing protein [Streptomyces sp. NPDC004787]|uniref:RHS repeat-associated core domain-containing protein n=1 Tax=Streptomyces sp. NPDC004787 TaxID=3154291 RepID=UPI0033B97679